LSGCLARFDCCRSRKPSASFHDFDKYERLVEITKADDARAHLVVLLGGDAGLRCGEIIFLQWTDADLTRLLLCVQRSGSTQRSMHLSPPALDAAIRLLEFPGGNPSRRDMVETDLSGIRWVHRKRNTR